MDKFDLYCRGKIGAAYCLYEETGLLQESIDRIYPFMDRILILISTMPWNGVRDEFIMWGTYRKLLNLKDPDNKIEIITHYWGSEAEQRNYGLAYFFMRGIQWCFVVDEDEFYNPSDLKNILPTLNSANYSVYLFQHQIYWKNRDTIVSDNPTSYPTIIHTQPGQVVFHTARMVTVYENKKWMAIDPNLGICHHMSYVRSDEQMLRKINNFSHVDIMVRDWYQNIWLKWTESMINIHPTNPESFKKAISVQESKYKLEIMEK